MQSYKEIIKAACLSSLELVQDGQVIGLGSGRAVAQVLLLLQDKIQREHMKLKFVPSSYQVEFLAKKLGLQIINLDSGRFPDLALDGADQVEIRTLNMIKGGGAALTREKIIDSFSKKVAIIIDDSKLTKELGHNRAVPVEVLPFGVDSTTDSLKKIGGKPTLRQGQSKVGPTITDNGNMIIDVDFGSIKDPQSLEKKIKMIPGVIEVGIFIDVADLVYVGRINDTVRVLRCE